jgi:hypothetical protein
MSATPKGCDSRWQNVVVGVRLTDGLEGTIVQRPSSPALISIDCQIYFHSLWCSAGFALHGWLTLMFVNSPT